MANVLMIVESPVKAKKIKSFFPAFEILATLGHFKDLPRAGMGVEPPFHKPEYVVMEGKEKIITKLRFSAKKADIIYVATDPDREGEAIAAHVANTLGNTFSSKISRVTYTEITKSAIEKAIQAKRKIDWQLVKAQEARRVLDRYIGYMVSSELSNKFKQAGINTYLSAGRVVSVALRLIVDRHNEILSFVPTTHYGVTATLIKSGIEFEAQWAPQLPPKTLMTDANLAHAVASRTHALTITQIDKQPKKVLPPQPLITTSYVKLVSAKLKITTKKAMDAAQTLFEHGLITYHRTDSPYMSPDFAHSVRKYAERNQLTVPPDIREVKAKANAQEAHECLRVTDITQVNVKLADVDDEYLSSIYQLIWLTTLESQLADGIDHVTTVLLKNAAEDSFIARTKQQSAPGWRAASLKLLGNAFYKNQADNNAAEIPTFSLPDLSPKESLTALKTNVITKKTEAPSIYNEHSLIDRLEKLGIGRPSSYASTIERMVTLNYVLRDKKLRITPQEIGIATTESLKSKFAFMDYQFTAELETAIDDIAERKQEYVKVVNQVWNKLQHEIALYKQSPTPRLPQSVKPIDEVTKSSSSIKKSSLDKTRKSPSGSRQSKVSAGAQCPTCSQGVLAMKKIANGPNTGKSFLGCNKFPACKHFQWSN